MPSEKTRKIESLRLLDWGFREFENYKLIKTNEEITSVGVWLGTDTHVPLLAKTDENRVQYNEERVKYWLEKGAKATDRVARFLSVNGLVKWEASSNPKKGEPGAKAKERAEERAEKEAAANAPAEAPAEEAAAE